MIKFESLLNVQNTAICPQIKSYTYTVSFGMRLEGIAMPVMEVLHPRLQMVLV